MGNHTVFLRVIIVLRPVISCKKEQDCSFLELIFLEKLYRTAIKTQDVPPQHHFSALYLLYVTALLLLLSVPA